MGKLIILGVLLGAAAIFALLEALDLSDGISAFVTGLVVLAVIVFFIPKNALIAVGFTVLGMLLAFGAGLIIKRMNE